MKLLLDTQILLWAAAAPQRLPSKIREMIESYESKLFFSPASLWEIGIKNSLGEADFKVDPRIFRTALEDHGYEEVSIKSEHVLLAHDLPPMHKDPFDRLLVAQSSIEGMGLLTVDQAMIDYGGTVIFDGD